MDFIDKPLTVKGRKLRVLNGKGEERSSSPFTLHR
jgi:hypothetical protein